MSAVQTLYGPESYCGAPPAPDQLWTRWNLDPVLLAALTAILVAYLVLAASGRLRLAAWRQVVFYAGWAVTTLCLISPLCPLSVSLAAARVGQHMLLAAVAAPSVALGLPQGRRDAMGGPMMAAVAFAAVLWFWHAPGPYDATFRSTAVYWSMHLSAFGAALWLWRSAFTAATTRLVQTLAAAAATSLQMGLLGAALTFADRPLYAPHLLTAGAWGLTPLADQQLAGAIMWVPAGIILTGAVVAGLAWTMREPERRAAAAAAS